ncbi:unnamed protein product, partial [Iphiclides podalirius]
MPYNKYNTRNSNRYNTPGQFVSSGELVLDAAQGTHQSGNSPQPNQQQARYGNLGQAPQPVQPPSPAEAPQPAFPPLPEPPMPPAMDREAPFNVENEETDINMESESNVNCDDGSTKPPWMKSKLSGVKKISNRERRRRQNENLRRLLSPKNALMVLNEMLPNEQLATQFKVEPVATNNQYYKPHNFVADLSLDGQSYKGFGENKLTARNAAAEQAIRDLIIKKMNKAFYTEASGGSESGEGDEEPLPMIQLASFALHKLFCEWEVEGHKVPQLRPPSADASGAAGAPPCPSPCLALAPAPGPRAPRRPKQLPEDAAQQHPCMLLTYMRPSLEYRELAAHGDRPQNMLYTIGVDVDGATYIGKAQNKKEARKAAARAACKAIFGVEFQN